ncbi:3-hydroxyisobutyryl-CoA hydrolase [Leucosporidium creatinivorum]|uniref:3-hydroxyisobutyryl-CoA hydrolase n=1 Tax=Leucosporidium creatinivorum TaxID=106004 RepID=A0A1Y2DJK0_9BASI|nr:3-hydroxyisobutyryl-CoA hydrolase [Leucosporidium creatinivorum]
MLSRVARSTSPSLLARMAPAQRLQVLSNHFSTSSSSSSSAPPPSSGAEAPVNFEATHSLRKITLNRPKAFNALSAEMVELIQPQLEKYESSSLANVVLFKGTGKHFCAGGDVVTLVKQLGDEATWARSSEFFQKEYTLNAYLANMKKPVVSIMHGFTLGGGVGLSMHIPFRIATETTSLGMPETSIGLFPDVGANFFLSRLDGALGVYLGLTGHTLEGKAAFLSGFASHYVPSERLESLEARLAELDQTADLAQVNSAIEEFVADAEELKAGPEYELVGARRRAIDLIFGKKSAEEIVEGLRALEEGTLDMTKIVVEGETTDVSALQRWAKETRETLEFRSPTSIKLALKAIREGARLDIDEVFLMDQRIATACCSPSVHSDFKTGVTHTLIEKKKTERAPWTPATLAEVTDSSITKTFFGSPPPFKNPPLSKLSFHHTQAKGARPYKMYPHAGFSLPTEDNIRDVVTGEAKGSGQFAMKEDEIVKKIVKQWKGKVGVEQKVREVLKRRCQVGQGETLKWVGY